ncbi:penicillin-binding protein 2 [Wenzhouxiangella marina]|uniref:Peptidoglycan D,D-transpeptidase MrdA n=1 Tax=Wenzhouxiangella marina TaxID=1579979 RepID=A0A0K0XSF7_9GAMM|nr:penicillin-binding protein 2 [Wenzhouxiangella marina]AKS40618.1 Penicillin-binding protein 2 [Wenzhouxiangella marina]MBB6088386.1 penicillin-binding protein 2 [Wenzhouxiangella marina]
MIGEATARVRDELSEQRLTAARFRVLVAIVLVTLGLLGWRFGHLQLGAHEQYAARAEENRIRLRALPPNRGLILDRTGRVLAENRPAYRLVVVPERSLGLDDTLERIRALVPISESEEQRFDRQRSRSRRFEPLTIKSNLSEAEVARLAIERHHLPGVEIEPYLQRHYPHGELMAHVVGYVGRMDARDRARLDPDQYRATTHVGKIGVERHFEGVLHGDSGLERVETNAQGRVLRVLERVSPHAGSDLSLTIDLELQRTAIEALQQQAGAVVLLDVATGEVLALVSHPGFDPNLFVHGIAQSDYDQLLRDPQRPLFNRFLSGGYEPGSTIKPFLALAGLEYGLITPETRVFSSGAYRLPGHEREYRDWRREGHGWVDLELALAESVNVYFYELAVELGIDRISRELALFGFGRATGLDLPGEGQGLLPTRSWKRAQFGQPWFPGETVITGIGQGFTVVTPLQLAHATAALAGRGVTATPSLLGPGEPVRMVVHQDWVWDAVFEGMAAVVHGPSGSARAIASRLPARMAGKTGTAQVFGRDADAEDEDERDQAELPEHLRNHALFIGFAPFEAPTIAVAVVVEHGGGGASVAAPVAAAVVARALELGY